MTVRSKPRIAQGSQTTPTRSESASGPRSSSPDKALDDEFSEPLPPPQATDADPTITETMQHFSVRNAYDQVVALDLNRDGSLDARDEKLAKQNGVPFAVEVTLESGTVVQLSSPERLAHAADVLATAIRGKTAVVEAELLEPPGAALARGISDSWPALVRRSNNVKDLVAALTGSNLPAPDGKLHVWVPASDPEALRRLTAEAAEYNQSAATPLVVETFTPGTDWRELDQSKPGILYLPQPFVVPGGRFTEMYGWDSYFIARGLLSSGRTDLARGMLEDQVYLIEHYGKIPNSSRSYHLSRSQPPFMPRLALELYQRDPKPENLALLEKVATAAEKELATVWNAPPQKTASGLSRFHDDASGPDLEVQRNLTSQGVFSWPDPEADRAARAAGWDLTHRYGDHAHLFEPVDLNSQLYRYELDLAEIERLVDGPGSERARQHVDGAEQRARTMQANQRMWSEQLGLFVDYDLKEGHRSDYESVATFAPLAAGWATPEQAKRVAENLSKFLEAGGLATSSRESRAKAGAEVLQWDWPNGWAPLQEIAVEGLRRYGFEKEANEVAYRWCMALLDIAGANNGLLPEKIDVHAVTADVEAAEYGNQGADRGSYWTPREENPQGFGWTNASFVTLREGLPAELQAALDRGVRPDALFGAR